MGFLFLALLDKRKATINTKKRKNKPRRLDGVVGFMIYAQVYLEKAFQILLTYLEQSNLSGIKNK